MLYKQRRPGLSTWFAGLSTVVPAPTSPLPQTQQRPELARHHESGKKVLVHQVLVAAAMHDLAAGNNRRSLLMDAEEY